MNKLHTHGGGLSKLPSVNQMVGQQHQHNHQASNSMGHMGEWLLA